MRNKLKPNLHPQRHKRHPDETEPYAAPGCFLPVYLAQYVGSKEDAAVEHIAQRGHKSEQLNRLDYLDVGSNDRGHYDGIQPELPEETVDKDGKAQIDQDKSNPEQIVE